MIKEIIKELFKKAGITVEDRYLSVPPDPKMGDISCTVAFALRKEMNDDPTIIAREIANDLGESRYIDRTDVVGPYINFFFDKEFVAEAIVKEILEKKDYGSNNLGRRKKALVEHTSINPNASPHIGRARNAIIGDTVVRVLKFENHDVEVHYFVNDIGKQIAMLVLGCDKTKKKITFDNLIKVYVDINRKAKKDKKLEQDVFGLLREFENRNPKAIKKFNRVVKICIDGQAEILGRLGIKYDYYDYESTYLLDERVEKVFRKLKKAGKVFVDEGRSVLDLRGFKLPMKGEPAMVLTRSDGTTMYGLRDLAYNLDKLKRAKKNVLILGEDQKLYFQQIKSALSLIGVAAPEVVHYSFVLLPEGKMSTRSGTVVLLKDFMGESVKKAEKEIRKRHKGIRGKKLEELAEKIGYAAIKYTILKVQGNKNVIFEWKQAMNFEGDSAPYLQYSLVRAKKILKKAGSIRGKEYKLSSDEEWDLVMKMREFPDVVKKVAKEYSVHNLATYAFQLAKIFNEFYEKQPVLKALEKKKKSRLLLLKAYSHVMENCLFLMGIEIPEMM